MEGKGQEVHGGEHHGEVFLAMAEVVFEVVAVVFEDVEALVLDLEDLFGFQLSERILI